MPIPPTAPAFVAVRVGSTGSELPVADPVDRNAPTADMIEVMLANGRRLRCYVQIEPVALHRLLVVLEQGH